MTATRADLTPSFVATEASARPDLVVEAAAVTRRYPVADRTFLTAVDSASLSVARGEFVAVEGRSGSGKSTLLAVLAGLERPDGGSVRILGRDIWQLDEAERARLRRHQVGIVFQSFALVGALDVARNVSLPLALDGVPEDVQRRQAELALSDVGLVDRVNQRIDDLSGGERQRVAIARALVTNPPVVLADEPTGSLDENTGESVLALLVGVVRHRGAALILVTHDAETAGRADRRFTMLDGRVTEVLP